MTDILVGAEQFADCDAVVRIGGDDVEDASRDSGAQSKLGGGERRQGRQFRWFQDDRTTGREGWRDFARHHR